MGWLNPVATSFPPATRTAPIGTSPCSPARRASSSARRMKASWSIARRLLPPLQVQVLPQPAEVRVQRPRHPALELAHDLLRLPVVVPRHLDLDLVPARRDLED